LRELELQFVLGQLSLAEEAAIRLNTPLVGLVRYKHGNIGRKGSVTFVRTQSKLALVAPNLPSEVMYIVFCRAGESGGKMRSFRARRAWILRALQLLKSTGIDSWDIDIAEERVVAWPEDGNLLDLVPKVETESGPAAGSGCEDTGPAPLQNAGVEDEQFFGAQEPESVDLMEETKSARSQWQAFIDNPKNPKVVIEGSEAKVEQSEVLPTKGFVNMQSSRHAWALAFPKLFPPRLIDGKRFAIFGDFTTNPFGTRDQTAKLHEWSEYCMWRSDGACVKHPTFAFGLEHEITHSSLQKQGRLSLQRSKIPFNLTLEELLKQNKTKEGMKSIKASINYSAGNVRGKNDFPIYSYL
jgi:hypothetical protein